MQRAVLDELCATGGTDQEIADNLFLSVDTIKSHMKAIRAAANVSGTRELLARLLNGQMRVVATPQRRGPKPKLPTVAHRAPKYGSILRATRCCHQLLADLPDQDTVTGTGVVTCGGLR